MYHSAENTSGEKLKDKGVKIFSGFSTQTELFEGNLFKSEMFLILIILNMSQAQIHMLQRTQSLLIFLPVPETSSDKSDTQRNHM